MMIVDKFTLVTFFLVVSDEKIFVKDYINLQKIVKN